MKSAIQKTSADVVGTQRRKTEIGLMKMTDILDLLAEKRSPCTTNLFRVESYFTIRLQHSAAHTLRNIEQVMEQPGVEEPAMYRSRRL